MTIKGRAGRGAYKHHGRYFLKRTKLPTNKMLVMRKTTIFLLLVIAFVLVRGQAYGQQQGYDISSGGPVTITGGLNATVTGSGDPTQNLAVTINFGEVTPANSNRIIKIVVPIAVRSLQPYQVTATSITSFNMDSRAVQATDMGFGVQNMRPLGTKGQLCTRSSHIITPLLNNDPAANVFFNSSGRAAYPSTIANIGTSTLLLSGPKLTQGTGSARTFDDGWVFDALFAITPQFYAPGTFSITLTFNIALGPQVQC
jgi:preprotein translocase subunit YajC